MSDKDKIKTYETDEIVIYWDPDKCQHAAECVHGAPAVFDTEKQPWVQPEHATAEEIMRVIDRCPSGALSYERKNN